MTLQQLRYAVKIAEKGSMNEAAKVLLISQPSLSNAIMELEKELGFLIFTRTNRGIAVTNQGMEFLGYARQVLTQMELLETKFISGRPRQRRLCISSQHYPFVANAFVEFVKEFGKEDYDFSLYETSTHEVIENVKTMFSEMGILYLSNYNETVLRRVFVENRFVFHELFCANPHVFLYREHPLAGKRKIELADLDMFPRISFNQGQYNAFYFSEEILSDRAVKKSISVSDRAAMVNFMIGLSGYTISSGVFPKYLHGEDIIAVPLNVEEKIQVGVITHKDASFSPLAKRFFETLKQYAASI